MGLLAQIALGLIVAGGIGFGVWNQKHRTEMMQDQTRGGISANATLTTGRTDTDLDRDMMVIDGQLKLTNDSSVDIDQSMNDKQIDQ